LGINLKDICFVTDDVLRLRDFYASVFGGIADGGETHATLRLDGMGFTFLRQRNPAFHYEKSDATGNMILTFDVDDVDAEYARMVSHGVVIVCAPTTHPWGARSFQFKDPDGNVLNFHTVVNRP